jgi:hypothetical protein
LRGRQNVAAITLVVFTTWEYYSTMDSRLHIALHHGLLALLLLALTSLPFAHRAGAAPITQDMMQYIALGGTLSDICGEEPGTHTAGGCESCRITASMMMPQAVMDFAPSLAPVASRLQERPRDMVALSLFHAKPPARAPPRP